MDATWSVQLSFRNASCSSGVRAMEPRRLGMACTLRDRMCAAHYPETARARKTRIEEPVKDQPITPPHDKPFHIGDYDPAETNGLSKDDALKQIDALRTRLNELQDLLYADRRFGLLVVLQA